MRTPPSGSVRFGADWPQQLLEPARMAQLVRMDVDQSRVLVNCVLGSTVLSLRFSGTVRHQLCPVCFGVASLRLQDTNGPCAAG